MAKGRVEKDKVASKDVFDNIGQSAENNRPKVEVLQKTIELLVETAKQLKKQLKDSIPGGVKPASIKSIEEFNELTRISNLNAQTKLKVDEKLRKEQLLLQKVTQDQTKALRNDVLLEQKQIGTLEKLEIQSRSLREERKKLNLSTKSGQVRLKEINRALDVNNAMIEKTSDTYKKQRIGIGRYEKAVNGLRGAIGKLGIAFGTISILKGSFDILNKFDEKIADIRKTTGLSAKSARELSIDLSNIDTRTSVENLQELAVGAGRLGITGSKNIKEFVVSVDKLFVALGDDLEGTADEIATTIGKISALFGFEKQYGTGEGVERIGSGINELSANSKAAAGPIVDFTNRMAAFSKIIKAQDVLALGAFFDEGGQSVEIAATTMQTLLPALASNYEKFAKIAGMAPEEFKKIAESAPIEALKKVAEGAKNNEKGLFNLSKIVESYGVESARATSIVGFLSNNTERLTELQQLSGKSIEENTSITDEFMVKNQTLGAWMEKLNKEIQKQVLGMDASGNVTGKVASVFKFLVQNLKNIIPVVVKLTKLFLVYKGVMMALKFKERITEIRDYNKAMKEGAKNVGDLSKESKGLAKSLKGIGWTALIALATEFAMTLYDVASGAARARFETEKLNKAREAGSKLGTNTAKKIQDNLQKEINAINLSVDSREVKDKKIAETQEKYRNQLQATIIELNKSRDASLDQLKIEEAKTKAIENNTSMYKKGSLDYITALGNQSNKELKVRQELKAKNAVIAELNILYKDLDQTVIDQTVSEIDSIQETNKARKESSDEQLSYLAKLKKEREDTAKSFELMVNKDTVGNEDFIDSQKLKLRELDKEIERVEKLLALENEKQKLRKELTDEELTDLINTQNTREDITDELLQQELDNLDLLANKKRLRNLESAANDEQIAGAELEIQKDLLRKKIKALEDYGKDATELKIELAQLERDWNNKLAEEEIKNAEQASDLRKEYIDLTTEYFVRKADERIKKIEQEMDASRKQADLYAELAANGSITAKESLAEENRLIAEAERQREEAEKRKQRILLVSSILQSYNSNLAAGDTSAEAFAKTVTSTELLKEFIQALPTFMDGIENTGKRGTGIDGKGGFLSVLHPEERVLTKEQNAKIGNYSNNDVASIIEKHRLGNFKDGYQLLTGWENQSVVDEMMKVGNKVDTLNATIKNRPVSNWDVGRITQSVVELVHTEKRGNRTTVTTYNIKR